MGGTSRTHILVAGSLLLVAAASSEQAQACSCGAIVGSMYPANNATDVARDIVLRCPTQACPEGTTLESTSGHSVAGTWSTLTLESRMTSGDLRFFRPSELLKANQGYFFQNDTRGGFHLFFTGEREISEGPTLPHINVSLGIDMICTTESTSCSTQTESLSVPIEISVTGGVELLVDHDCSTTFDAERLTGSVSSLAAGWLWVGADLCSAPWRELALGEMVPFRFGAIGANGSFSGWTDPVVFQMPTVCDPAIVQNAFPENDGGQPFLCPKPEEPEPEPEASAPEPEAELDSAPAPEPDSAQTPKESDDEALALECTCSAAGSGAIGGAACCLLFGMTRGRRQTRQAPMRAHVS
jgi:hypothetical protein